MPPPEPDDTRPDLRATPPVPVPPPAAPPPGYYPPAPRRYNGNAIASMIVSVVSTMSCQLIGAVGIYLGHRARKEIQATGEEGDGFATAGIIVGWVSLVIGILVFCFAGVALALSILPMMAATTM